VTQKNGVEQKVGKNNKDDLNFIYYYNSSSTFQQLAPGRAPRAPHVYYYSSAVVARGRRRNIAHQLVVVFRGWKQQALSLTGMHVGMMTCHTGLAGGSRNRRRTRTKKSKQT